MHAVPVEIEHHTSVSILQLQPSAHRLKAANNRMMFQQEETNMIQVGLISDPQVQNNFQKSSAQLQHNGHQRNKDNSSFPNNSEFTFIPHTTYADDSKHKRFSDQEENLYRIFLPLEARRSTVFLLFTRIFLMECKFKPPADTPTKCKSEKDMILAYLPLLDVRKVVTPDHYLWFCNPLTTFDPSSIHQVSQRRGDNCLCSVPTISLDPLRSY